MTGLVVHGFSSQKWLSLECFRAGLLWVGLGSICPCAGIPDARTAGLVCGGNRYCFWDVQRWPSTSGGLSSLLYTFLLEVLLFGQHGADDTKMNATIDRGQVTVLFYDRGMGSAAQAWPGLRLEFQLHSTNMRVPSLSQLQYASW